MSNYALCIVDDEEDIRRSLKRALKKWADRKNVLIKLAASAKEALEMLENEHAETAVIISDQKMPQRTGSDFLKEVTALYPDVVTIVLTGHADTSDMGDFIEAGIFAFLEKPWDNAKLVAEVEKALEVFILRRKSAEQERLLQADLAMAADFQELFLMADIPKSACFQFDTAYRYAKQLSFGGDYFDIIQLNDERYLLLLGNVAGHGLKAAFLVSILKSIIFSEFLKGKAGDEISPAEFLMWLNKRMQTILHRTPDLFLAFSACCIDAHTRTLSCANGGQPPPLLIAKTRVVEICPPQPALGVDDSFAYSEVTHRMSSGDIVLLCTDGVFPTGKKVHRIDKTLFYELLKEMRTNNQNVGSILKTLANSEQELFEEDDATIISARMSGVPPILSENEK
jgi:sigma-B regulation protein RsbU (phosphoserine phosphatase)